MRKLALIIILFIFSSFFVFSLEVDIDELKKSKKIQFENYKGKYAYVETVRNIRAIGFYLARNKKVNEVFRYHLKYSIIHAVDDTTNDLLEADIFSIDRDARVDHIRNIRLIISSYLEKKYGYTRKEAQTLAVFVTFYNAIYRGDVEYFSQKYKPVVIQYINNTNAGISTKYYEWPGRTKIIIPLTEEAKRGEISSLDTDELTDEKIIEELKKEDDKSIEDRKEMVKIEEKEIKEDKKEIKEEKKEIEEDKKKIEDEKKELEDKKKEIEDKKDEIKKEEEKIEEKKEEIKKIEDEEERKKEEEKVKKEEEKLEEKKDDVKKEEEDVTKKEEEVTKKEEETKKKEDKIVKKEEKVKKKEEKVKKEKEDIKKDEIKGDPEKFKKELDKKEEELKKKEEELKKKEDEIRKGEIDEKIYQDKFYYLKIKEYMSGGHYNNEMYIIDAKTAKIVLKSPLKNICGKKYLVFSEGVAVITFESTHDSNHYLALLDLETLEVKAKGQANIFWRSFIEVKDSFIFAVIKDGENFFLGKFNTKLEIIAKSEEKVESATFISFYKDYIYINSDNKKILVLDKNNLKKIGEVKP